MKEAALQPFEEQKLPVKYIFGNDDKDLIARTFAAERGTTAGMCVRSGELGRAPPRRLLSD